MYTNVNVGTKSVLREYLEMGDENRIVKDKGETFKISIRRVRIGDPKSPVTLRNDFKYWYELWANERFKDNQELFEKSGFISCSGWLCRSCQRKSQKDCCDKYDRVKNATKKMVFFGMDMVVEKQCDSNPE